MPQAKTRPTPALSSGSRIAAVSRRIFRVRNPFVVMATERRDRKPEALRRATPRSRSTRSSLRKGSPPVTSSSFSSASAGEPRSCSQSPASSSGVSGRDRQMLHMTQRATQRRVTSMLSASGAAARPVARSHRKRTHLARRRSGSAPAGPRTRAPPPASTSILRSDTVPTPDETYDTRVARRRATLLLLFSFGVAAVTVVAMLASLQRRLLYFPAREELSRATAAARRAGLEPWSDQGRFLGWRARHPGQPARAIVLVLHGNAGSALDRAYYLDVFQRSGAVDVVLLEYPGYGPRDGEPSQESLVAACSEALTLLRGERLPIALVGESLGSAVASLAAAEQPADVAGLFLVTPLASVTAVAKRHYPFIPSALVADAYRADLALPRYPGPVAFLVAGRDEVVFSDLGLALHEARTGPKRLWVEPQSGHNDLAHDPRDPKWRDVLRFLLPEAG